MFPPEHSLTHAQTDGQPENIVFNQSPFRRFGATWVEICPFPLLWLLAFTTACTTVLYKQDWFQFLFVIKATV